MRDAEKKAVFKCESSKERERVCKWLYPDVVLATLVDCNDPFVGNNHKSAAMFARA